MQEKKRIQELLNRHNEWMKESITLIASENAMSPLAESLMVSDLLHRYAEGWPKKRFYQGLEIYDEIELETIALAKKLFGAEFVDLRPISGALANLSVQAGLGDHGDKLMVMSTSSGAHISQAEFGAAGIRGLDVKYLPFDFEEMNIDADKAAIELRKEQPKIVTFGATLFLFPHPVKELAPVVKEFNGTITMDAAHILGLIAGGIFHDPLREGVDIVSASTHKTFPGPQGGLVFTNSKEIFKKVQFRIFPGLVSNHHLFRIPALGITLAEMLEFGHEYAGQVVRNSKALAQALHEHGFKVLCEHKGFTESHQILVDVREQGKGKFVAEELEKANIILNKNLMPWDDHNDSQNPSGIRIGVSEMTRRGMKENEMKDIALLFKRILMDKEGPAKVKADIVEMRRQFSKVGYC